VHGAGDETWSLAWPALEWLEQTLRPGMETLETGAGVSTMVFAAVGTVHESITVSRAEMVRLRDDCARRGISLQKVTFHVGPSHEVLPTLARRQLDLVLIDGAHAFPYPVLDWWHVAPRLKLGGCLMIDDCHIPAVAILVEHLRSLGSWRIVARPGRRALVVAKVNDEPPPYEWKGERLVTGVTFRHLPLLQRPRASVTHRVLESRLALKFAALLRTRSRRP
jgi:hypothetical protein